MGGAIIEMGGLVRHSAYWRYGLGFTGAWWWQWFQASLIYEQQHY